MVERRRQPEVSIHAPVRARLTGKSSAATTTEFQSTRPLGRDAQSFILRFNVPKFQSTRPLGRDIAMSWEWDECRGVSIHAPVRARLYYTAPNLVCQAFQSTRPLGRDPKNGLFLGALGVSIHAPVRARLFALKRAFEDAMVSIHAPVRARLEPANVRRLLAPFQSTRPKPQSSGYRGVSIHAPVRARRSPGHWLPGFYSFNPRAR